MFLVKSAPEIRIRETLFESKEIFRIGGMEANPLLFNETAAVDEGLFTIAEWTVNEIPFSDLTGNKMLLIEVVFNEPQPLDSLAIGGTWGRSDAWLYSWRGGWYELIAFDDLVPEPAILAVRHYLRLKWSLSDLKTQSTPQGRALAGSFGVHFGNIFGSLFLLK